MFIIKPIEHIEGLLELQLLLDNSQYKIKALEIAQIIQAENGVKTVCDAIEAF